MSKSPRLASQGLSHQDVLARMRAMRTDDARWQEGRTWSLVYNAGEDIRRVAAEAYTEFMSENGLSPLAFPSLRRFEAEVLAIAAELFHGDTAAGTMTSGGTESILMAVKTARDFARAERGISEPEMVLPASAHPAFQKAAHYFGVKPVTVPVAPDFRADVEAMRAAIGPHTVLVVGSAPSYPHGVMDPISELAAMARDKGVLFHVDACLGGFLLPFARRLGHSLPDFDFAVPGVTSLSADLHKYGYAAKGASVILYRSPELRRHQFFTYGGWSGGIYASPSMAGTRPGGAIAAAWAILKYLGEEGYLRLARTVLDTSKALREGISSIPGLKLLGQPPLSVFAFSSDTLDVYALGDAMEARGWKLDRQMLPPALHLMVTPAHAAVVEPFLSDLRACAASLASGEPAPDGSAALYGMLGSLPDPKDAEGFILQFMDGLYGDE
ncbi:aspartate aminotransferase family protein [Vitiosangium sp. GDMCC 1.1324]|uniref:pyridoxal phosphate-dependent decarboxylase family protein n=1 Tax=Vitiosangium sp. (strain GDMCC 1.1324) TaxID=2138576 RepID=UPI000D3A7CE5|nr:aspartate aminotransferase family protein [Vitiosangium sp. GDMCC 1.1324]PTL77915.1 aspartate aminotransferase family protein [Vitiosangium sp. GDMCC 1.1324]